MTFKQIVDAVLSDRFGEGQRGNAQTWVNHRYWWLWSLEPWPFKFATDAITVTSGSQTPTSLPTDLKTVYAIYRADGAPLERIRDHADFLERYVTQTPAVQGEPEAFMTFGSTVLIGPTPNVSSTAYTMLYEKECTLMVADADTPALPAGSHFALVHGGAAEGLKLQNDPTWQAFEEDFKATLSVLRETYLPSIGGSGYQLPAYRPGR